MKHNTPTLSIVVPVYNVKEYLTECIESFYNEHDDVQIILVDDGSTDGSSEICNYLANRKNIEAWHKKNGGLASARNYGTKKAKGKYIAFIDSDDKIETRYFSKIINYLKQHSSDVYFMNITKFYPDGRREDMGENITKENLRGNKDRILNYLSTRKKFPASAWGKIYKRDFLIKNNLFFPNDNRISEDLGFSLKVIKQASTYDKIDMPYYLYRQKRNGSITNTISSKSFDGVSLFVSEFANEKNKDLLSFVAYEYIILLWLYNYVSKEKRKQAKNILQQYEPILKYCNTSRTKVIRILTKFFGLTLTSKLLYIIKRKP